MMAMMIKTVSMARSFDESGDREPSPAGIPQFLLSSLR
jgi:hypothetical protein